MELVVISSPTLVPNEASTINALLDEGLSVFHLRKPEWSVSQMDSIVGKIKPEFRSRITVHSHHVKAEDWGLTRLHFPVALRSTIREDVFVDIAQHKTISTSTHSISEFMELPKGFHYSFCGPVYRSISKPGYESDFLFNQDLIRSGQSATKMFALGGIDESNIPHAVALGFQGIALLGAIWNSPDPVKKFVQVAQIAKVISDQNKNSR